MTPQLKYLIENGKPDIEAYLKFPILCLYCGDCMLDRDDAGAGDGAEGTTACQEVTCSHCGASWTEEFTLTSIRRMEGPDDIALEEMLEEDAD